MFNITRIFHLFLVMVLANLSILDTLYGCTNDSYSCRDLLQYMCNYMYIQPPQCYNHLAMYLCSSSILTKPKQSALMWDLYVHVEVHMRSYLQAIIFMQG